MILSLKRKSGLKRIKSTSRKRTSAVNKSSCKRLQTTSVFYSINEVFVSVKVNMNESFAQLPFELFFLNEENYPPNKTYFLI